MNRKTWPAPMGAGRRLWALIALAACAITMTGCALIPGSSVLRADGQARVAARQAQALTAAPPQIETPAEAEARCEIYILPLDPTLADLEVGYQTRGAQLMACDGRRALAVSAHAREHELEAAWLRLREARARRPWWPF